MKLWKKSTVLHICIILTLFSKIFFHGSDFGSSKTFFPWSDSCVGSNKLMWTWVQVTRTWPWAAGYYPPNRVPTQHWLKGGGHENRRVLSGGGDLNVSRVYRGISTLRDTPPRARRQLGSSPSRSLAFLSLSLLQNSALSFSLISSCLFIRIVAFLNLISEMHILLCDFL